jgi:hypothetical protein
MTLSGDEPQPGQVDVAINWSTMAYPRGTGHPPIPPLDPVLEQEWIVRQPVFSGPIGVGENRVISGTTIIPNFNPEWVSIDVRGMNVGVYNGQLIHECVPEPATLAMLLGGGLLGLLVCLRRRWTR